MPFAPNAISCLDVLEHLADPVRALRHMAGAAAVEARMVLTVPAMPSLASRWDDLCGHHRRYTRGLLHRVQEMEFPPVSARVNGLLTFAGTVERVMGNPMPFGASLIATARRA